MAKKNNKATRKSNVTSTNNNPQTHDPKPTTETDKKPAKLGRLSSMEDTEEKVQNLKSLNAVLVKQTVETRQQIDSLVQAKDELENELARYGSEKSELESELDQVSDENLGLKMELDLVMGFVGDRFREMGFGIERLMIEKESEIRVLKSEVSEVLSMVEIEKEEFRKVSDERDWIKNGFELEREEANRLKESVVKLEEKESSLEMTIERLNSENDTLVKEKKTREDVIEGVTIEKIVLEMTMEEKVKEIDGLKREIGLLSVAKNEIETVKIGEIEELEKRLSELNESVEGLTKEKSGLRDMVIGLEKSLDESKEKEKAMLVQVDALGKEKAVKESELERVMEEKDSVEKDMEMVNVLSSYKERLIDELSREKSELEDRISSQESKLVELNLKVDELKDAVAALRKDCNDRTKVNKKLIVNNVELRNALTKVELERDEAVRALNEEKSDRKDLQEAFLNSEKWIKSYLKELETVKIERDSLFTAKNDLESLSESWKRQKDILEQELVELKKAVDALKTELESADADAKQRSVMLKRVASMVSQGKNREDKEENGTESYAVELESIEKAFRNKEDIIEEMKKEAETMKQSREEAHKKKSFWTAVSSLTTIFAAASFAYAARSR